MRRAAVATALTAAIADLLDTAPELSPDGTAYLGPPIDDNMFRVLMEYVVAVSARPREYLQPSVQGSDGPAAACTFRPAILERSKVSM